LLNPSQVFRLPLPKDQQAGLMDVGLRWRVRLRAVKADDVAVAKSLREAGLVKTFDLKPGRSRTMEAVARGHGVEGTTADKSASNAEFLKLSQLRRVKLLARRQPAQVSFLSAYRPFAGLLRC